MTKNILLISTFYPPVQHTATNRIFSFAKYLDKQKYHIFVVTINTGERTLDDIDGITVYRLTDNSPFKKSEIKKFTHPFVHRIKAAYNFFIIHSLSHIEMHDWQWKAVELSRALIEHKGIDVILSSFAPITPHLVALNIKKHYPNIRWIADMRDEMVSPDERNPLHRAIVQRWQTKILAYTDSVTSVSEPLLKDFQQNCERKDVLFKEIRNGYDFEIETIPNTSNHVFTIVYTGTFYGKRSPENLFKVLQKLLQERDILVKIKIFGVPKPLNIPANLKNVISTYEKVDHTIALQEIKQADILLLILPTIRQKGVYTGKLFEYLASLKPILALVPPNDVAAQLIRDCNAGYIADNDDLEGIEQTFLHAYNDWLEGRVLQRNLDLIKHHHRKEQAKILESLIDELIQRH